MQSSISARLFDQPVPDLPQDLYIPPAAFAIWLEQFEGPLDFLLYLVKKNQFDVTTTAILPIIEQYLGYIDNLNKTQFELAGDYLLMASTLIHIKSQLLLPRPESTREQQDPRQQLVIQLQRYAQIKDAAERLDSMIILERDVFAALATPLPLMSDAPVSNVPTWSAELLQHSLTELMHSSTLNRHHVYQDVVPLAERLQDIRSHLNRHRRSNFTQLLNPAQGRLGVVVSFVAVLELLKQGQVRLGLTNNTADEHMTDANSYHLTNHEVMLYAN